MSQDKQGWLLLVSVSFTGQGQEEENLLVQNLLPLV